MTIFLRGRTCCDSPPGERHERPCPLAALTPASFVTEVLPSFARRQQLESLLAETGAAESGALAGLTEAITLLNRAVSLRERLERALERAGGPLRATESAERAEGVRPDASEALKPAQAVRSGGLSKPGPY